MIPMLNDTLTTSATKADYTTLLRQHGVAWQETEYHLQVGTIPSQWGWIIHLSVITAQMHDLLETVIPLLIKREIPFKLVRNKIIAQSVLEGKMGYVQLGKVISIYPDDTQALTLAQELVVITQTFKGPHILTDRHLGGIVYTRWGAFQPVIMTRADGSQAKCYYNTRGELIKDQYTIPFTLHEGMSWPFASLVSPKAPVSEKVLKDKYRPMATLKSDAKGDVIKALYLKKILLVQWCLIKQGRKAMLVDDHGRDIQDRLHWQYELHKDLQGVVSIPAVYDLFEENGDTYLVMEYVKGTPLDNIVTDIYQQGAWLQLPLPDRLKLLDYAMQILDMVEAMHHKGYIHRDITSVNFLVNKKQRLVMIDLELVYSEKQQRPQPPFTLGTAGFMSPEQEAVQTPTVQEDIYGLGATLLVLFTGLVPGKFENLSPTLLKSQLSFFIPDEELVKIIAGCLHPNPTFRPPLTFIKGAVREFRQQQQSLIGNTKPVIPIDKKLVHDIIDHTINGLSTQVLMGSEMLWFSKMRQEAGLAYYQAEEITVYGEWETGASGVCYLLGRAAQAGFDITSCMEGYNNSLQFITQGYLPQITSLPAGLYTGTAGIALALIERIKSGLFTDAEQTILQLRNCLQSEALDGPCVAHGVAGQGLALLAGATYLPDDFVQYTLQKQVSYLLKSQQKDGSWLIATDNTQQTFLQFTGFSYGVAGIICFLIEYVARTKDKTAQVAVEKAMGWLNRQGRRKDGQLTWPLFSKSRETGLGLNDGAAGITLAFIKAYALFQTPLYQQVAENALHSYPTSITGRDLTLANGLAGIGETYLEAARVFNSSEWQVRADWIAAALLHHYRLVAENACYWLVDQKPFSTADFMTGNSGIIHFLARYAQPGKLSHPLLAF